MENFNPQFQKIGDILVYQKVISKEQLEKALNEQKSSNEKLGHILISQGSISEEDLVNAYSMQCGHRAITQDEILQVDQSILSFIPLPKVCVIKHNLPKGCHLFKFKII